MNSSLTNCVKAFKMLLWHWLFMKTHTSAIISVMHAVPQWICISAFNKHFCRNVPEQFKFRFARTVWQQFHFYFLYFVVDVLLKAVGDTPIMKTKKWAVDRGRTVQSLAQFISRFLKLDAGEQLVRDKLIVPTGLSISPNHYQL